MSRKSAYKQVLSIGTAVVLGFALFTGSLDGAPKLLSPQSDEQAVALAEKQNESPKRTGNEADLVAGSNREQPAPRTPAMAPNPPHPTPVTPLPKTAPPPPSTRSKTPTLTAPAAYTSAAFPTTPATPTLPFVPTARTRSARRHSHSMNTSAPPKRAALRNSPSSTAWSHSQGARLCRPRVARTGKARRYLAHPSLPVGTSSATTLFRARASTTAATLSPGRSAAKTPTARISSPARAISTRRACCRLKSRFSTIFAIRATMCSTASRLCITKRNLSPWHAP